MTDRKHILVLYHANCTDGWTAAWAAWKKFGDSAEYLPATYQSGEIFDVAGREVYFLDYCPEPPQALDDYAKLARSVTVLDHHKSSKEACEKFEFSKLSLSPSCFRFERFFDLNRSGAAMAWDYFHLGKPRPALVNYVEDRDLWRWALPDSRTINMALSSYAHGDFDAWQRLVDLCENVVDRSVLYREGSAIERSRAIDIAAYKRNAMRGSFAGHQGVPIVNVAGNIVSDLLSELATKDFFAVGWNQMSDGVFRYSLRSIGNFDVAAIAAKWGGGGHKNAAGFNSNFPPWTAMMTHGDP